jgi:hypothetical protein
VFNKVIYANIGGSEVLRSTFCAEDSFGKTVEIICDGRRLEGLHELELEGVIILNMCVFLLRRGFRACGRLLLLLRPPRTLRPPPTSPHFISPSTMGAARSPDSSHSSQQLLRRRR